MSEPINVLLIHKLVCPGSRGVTTLGTRQALQFPKGKLMSPGIRQMAHSDLDRFLDSMANTTCSLPDDEVEPRVLLSAELRSLALLVEEGSRVMESSVFDETDSQTLVIKLRRP